jgi:hypothetical protein
MESAAFFEVIYDVDKGSTENELAETAKRVFT